MFAYHHSKQQYMCKFLLQVDHDKRRFYGLVVISMLFASVIFSFNTWGIAFDTFDDMVFGLSTFRYWHETALLQGRVIFYIHGPLAMLPYVVDSIHFLSFVRVAGLLLFAISFSLFLAVFLGSRFVFPLSMILLAGLWQNTIGGHNLLVAYPFYMLVHFSLFLLCHAYLIFRVKGEAEFSVRQWLAGGAALALLFAWEFALQYYFFTVLVIFCVSNKTVYETCKGWLVPVSLIYFVAAVLVVVFRWMFPSRYAGNSEVNLETSSVFTTHLTLSLGLIPGRQISFAEGGVPIGMAELYLVVGFSLSALLIIFALWRYRHSGNILQKRIHGSRVILFYLTGVVFFISPLALVSLTEKYQAWVLVHGVTNIHYSAFAYFAFIGVVCGFARMLFEYKVGSALFALVVSIFVAAIQAHNIGVSESQRDFFAKWPMFRAALSEIQDITGFSGPRVSLNSNFFVGIPEATFWTRYAQLRHGVPIEFVEGPGSDVEFVLERNEAFGPAVFVFYNGRLVSVVSRGSDDDGSIWLTALGAEQDLLRATNGAHSGFELTAVPSSDSGLIIRRPVCAQEFELSNGVFMGPFGVRDPDSSLVGFGRGFYGLESAGCEYWRWAEAPAELLIRSSPSDSRFIRLRIVAANDAELTFMIADKWSVLPISAGKIKDVCLDLSGISFPAELQMFSSEPSVQLNLGDPRLFSFAVFSLAWTESMAGCSRLELTRESDSVGF